MIRLRLGDRPSVYDGQFQWHDGSHEAPFDSRAYRFRDSHPKLRFFEVDLPATIDLKEKRVARVLDDLGPEELTRRYLTRSDGRPDGKTTDWQRIIDVKVP